MKRILSILAIASMVLLTANYAYPAVLVVSTKGDAAYKDGAAWRPLAKGQTRILRIGQ